MDLGVILLSLPITLPVMVLIAGYIKLVSPGPVFFVQNRIGYQGQGFRCFKFRTMETGADQTVHQAHLANLIAGAGALVKLDLSDARVIPMGQLLRASGLDELPQFLNVIRGEMSLIGPRPCTEYESNSYLPWHRERFQALPGISGLWQVTGKNRTTFGKMIRRDIQYVRRASLGLDCWILGRTAGVVLAESRVVLRHWRQFGIGPGAAVSGPGQYPGGNPIPATEATTSTASKPVNLG